MGEKTQNGTEAPLLRPSYLKEQQIQNHGHFTLRSIWGLEESDQPG